MLVKTNSSRVSSGARPPREDAARRHPHVPAAGHHVLALEDETAIQARVDLDGPQLLLRRGDVRPPSLRYFGGKWVLAPWIIGHMLPHRVYVEPFGGAASVLLRKPRSRVEVYNDPDGEVVSIFRILQDSTQCRELVKHLRRTPYSRREFERTFEASAEPIEQARRAIGRCYMAFHHSALFDPKKTFFAAASHSHGGRVKSHE